MARFGFETKNQVDINKKPRVFFTCHPDDFKSYFKRVCDDIFKTHDCIIYYTEDMTEAIAEEDKEIDLARNNLFVVPVTFKLLSTPNRAMDEDIPYALKNHIPVLPIMMESGIDGFYSAPDKFGDLQYLTPKSADITEISYEEKLKKYLDSVLVGDELAERIRQAFDAYIFLSYRKKDRKYANELMQLIHSNRECRDIAIWFDEFLTPGESFKENILKILSNSKLFTLLVTPNLLEEPDGKPNFVMSEEYPAALRTGIEILPAEMENTDKAALDRKFRGIPSCVDPHNDAAFKARLLETLSKIAITTNDDNPEHSYYIGLAYLEGIDVEVNRERGLALITSAAEAGYFSAMDKLFSMYRNGDGVRVNQLEAIKWAEKMFAWVNHNLGEEHPDSLLFLDIVAIAYEEFGNSEKTLEIREKIYALKCKCFGLENPVSLNELHILAFTYRKFRNYEKAIELYEKLLELKCKALGEEHSDSLLTLNHLAVTYGDFGNHKKAIELTEKLLKLKSKAFGGDYPEKISDLSSLAMDYCKLGDFKEAMNIVRDAYSSLKATSREESEDALTLMQTAALIYNALGDNEKEKLYMERVFRLSRKIFGDEHPEIVNALEDLVATYIRLGEYSKALDFAKVAYSISLRVFGEEHPEFLDSVEILAAAYQLVEDYEKAQAFLTKALSVSSKLYGYESLNSFRIFAKIGTVSALLGDKQKALEMLKMAYLGLCKHFGKDHPEAKGVENQIKILLSKRG